MRIPFLPRVGDPADLGVEQARFDFIRQSRGGSSFLFAGAAFWLIGAVLAMLRPDWLTGWIVFGGLSVPVVGVLIGRVQGVRFGRLHTGYASLAGVAVTTELAALPVLLFLREDHPEVLPAVLLIADGAHLLVLMWLHLDYYYFLSANLKVVLGILVLFRPELLAAPVPLAVSGLISLLAALGVWRDSARTMSLYVRSPGPG